MNRVQLIGNLGKDAEVKTMPSGSTLTSFSVATEERYKDKDSNWQHKTTWHRVAIWDAKPHVQALHKGQRVYIEGSIDVREYTGSDGVKKTTTEIKAFSVEILFVPERQDARQDAPPSKPWQPSGQVPGGTQRGAQVAAHGNPAVDLDDVPFSFLLLAPIAGYLAQFVGV
jgi:single-strand DNA-binding protein